VICILHISAECTLKRTPGEVFPTGLYSTGFMKLINELLHDSCGMARFNSVAEESHGRIEWRHLSLTLHWILKVAFARFDAAPSIRAHFQFIIEEISDKHNRPSAGKAIVQHKRNSKGRRKQEETKVPRQTKYTKHKRAS